MVAVQLIETPNIMSFTETEINKFLEAIENV